MPKSKEEVTKFIEALDDAGFDPASYSGRGMFGKQCVSVQDVSAWKIARELTCETYDGEFEDLPEPRQDQLGLGFVLYWPSYEWPKDKE